MINVIFSQLLAPTSTIVKTFNKWATDLTLVPLLRLNRNQVELEVEATVTMASLKERLEHNVIYLIHVDGKLVGEMNFQIGFDYLYKKEPGTAWIGIAIGKSCVRNKGIGTTALLYLEKQIKLQGLNRIELGVFEFNAPALKLYQKAGYQKIGCIKKFTYWQGKMWSDIRMEKYL